MQFHPHHGMLGCRALDGGTTQDVTPGQESGFNVRTRVHEYGGGEYVLANDAVFFSNFKARARLLACSLCSHPSASKDVFMGLPCHPSTRE